MVDTKKFVKKLIKEFDIEEVCGVPCSTMTPLIAELENLGRYKPFTNEGDAVAYAAGNIVSGRKVAVILQNSGLTNASSPISSLTSLYGIPMLYFVGWRGDPDFGPDEPQHKIIGKNTVQVIKNISSRQRIYSLDRFSENVKKDDIFDDEGLQTFVLVHKGDFSKVESSKTEQSTESIFHVSRYDIVKSVKEFASKFNNISIITTTGYTSRELMSLGEDDEKNFYCFGSMGCAYPFALGLAKANPDRKFIVIDGDGSCAMRFENSFLGFTPRNLFRIVVNNGMHQSTGGQQFTFSEFEYALLGQSNYQYVTTLGRLESELKAFSNDDSFYPYKGIVVEVNLKTKTDLPRPKLTPEEILSNFKEGLKSNETRDE